MKTVLQIGHDNPDGVGVGVATEVGESPPLEATIESGFDKAVAGVGCVVVCNRVGGLMVTAEYDGDAGEK